MLGKYLIYRAGRNKGKTQVLKQIRKAAREQHEICHVCGLPRHLHVGDAERCP